MSSPAPIDISGSGVSILLSASILFPAGIEISELADDIDAVDHSDWTVGDNAVGLNGNYLYWVIKNPFTVTVSVVPDSQTDNNLAILLQSYRNGNSGIITLAITYPGQNPLTYGEGSVISGPPAPSVATNQRKKSQSYVFGFGGVTIA